MHNADNSGKTIQCFHKDIAVLHSMTGMPARSQMADMCFSNIDFAEQIAGKYTAGEHYDGPLGRMVFFNFPERQVERTDGAQHKPEQIVRMQPLWRNKTIVTNRIFVRNLLQAVSMPAARLAQNRAVTEPSVGTRAENAPLQNTASVQLYRAPQLAEHRSGAHITLHQGNRQMENVSVREVLERKFRGNYAAEMKKLRRETDSKRETVLPGTISAWKDAPSLEDLASAQKKALYARQLLPGTKLTIAREMPRLAEHLSGARITLRQGNRQIENVSVREVLEQKFQKKYAAEMKKLRRENAVMREQAAEKNAVQMHAQQNEKEYAAEKNRFYTYENANASRHNTENNGAGGQALQGSTIWPRRETDSKRETLMPGTNSVWKGASLLENLASAQEKALYAKQLLPGTKMTTASEKALYAKGILPEKKLTAASEKVLYAKELLPETKLTTAPEKAMYARQLSPRIRLTAAREMPRLAEHLSGARITLRQGNRQIENVSVREVFEQKFQKKYAAEMKKLRRESAVMREQAAEKNAVQMHAQQNEYAAEKNRFYTYENANAARRNTENNGAGGQALQGHILWPRRETDSKRETLMPGTNSVWKGASLLENLASAQEKAMYAKEVLSGTKLTTAQEKAMYAKGILPETKLTAASEKVLYAKELLPETKLTTAPEKAMYARQLSPGTKLTTAPEKAMYAKQLSPRIRLTAAREMPRLAEHFSGARITLRQGKRQMENVSVREVFEQKFQKKYAAEIKKLRRENAVMREQAAEKNAVQMHAQQNEYAAEKNRFYTYENANAARRNTENNGAGGQALQGSTIWPRRETDSKRETLMPGTNSVWKGASLLENLASAQEKALYAKQLLPGTKLTFAQEKALYAKGILPGTKLAAAPEKALHAKELLPETELTTAPEKALYARQLSPGIKLTTAQKKALYAKGILPGTKLTAAQEKALYAKQLLPGTKMTTASEKELYAKGILSGAKLTSAPEKELYAKQLSPRIRLTAAREMPRLAEHLSGARITLRQGNRQMENVSVREFFEQKFQKKYAAEIKKLRRENAVMREQATEKNAVQMHAQQNEKEYAAEKNRFYTYENANAARHNTENNGAGGQDLQGYILWPRRETDSKRESLMPGIVSAWKDAPLLENRASAPEKAMYARQTLPGTKLTTAPEKAMYARQTLLRTKLTTAPEKALHVRQLSPGTKLTIALEKALYVRQLSPRIRLTAAREMPRLAEQLSGARITFRQGKQRTVNTAERGILNMDGASDFTEHALVLRHQQPAYRDADEDMAWDALPLTHKETHGDPFAEYNSYNERAAHMVRHKQAAQKRTAPAGQVERVLAEFRTQLEKKEEQIIQESETIRVIKEQIKVQEQTILQLTGQQKKLREELETALEKRDAQAAFTDDFQAQWRLERMRYGMDG